MAFNNRFNFDAIFDKSEYWDFVLTNDENEEFMDLTCLNTVIKENLGVHIDISDTNSWNLNTGYTVNSLISYDNAITSNITLNDFGLTQYDNGLASSLTASTSLTVFNNKLILYRIGENDATGNTTTNYSSYDITGVTASSSTVGNYFDLNGGYLQGYFKLADYEYELIPYRYEKGITIETWIKIDTDTFTSITGNTDGYFYFMGARAENKYSIIYSGETGVTASTGISLGSDNITGSTVDYEENISNNVIGFKFNSDKSISYRIIGNDGILEEKTSPNTINSTGWTHIAITYKPYEGIPNKDILHCYPTRKSDMNIYVNGFLFWKEKNVNELWFKPLNTEKEKQIGVPYNISWGGGSFGLKHSWHFSGSGDTEMNLYEQDTRKNNLLIQDIYDGSFNGGIQKLRIYMKAFNITEIRHNFNTEKLSFGRNETFGGRSYCL